MTAEKLWDAFCHDRQIEPGTPYEAWAFGAAPDNLAELVLRGLKTATASAYDLYFTGDSPEPLPKAGDYSVILNSTDEAVCVIQTTRTTVVPFEEVTEEHARKEGEGDLSLTYWRAVHEEYFEEEFASEGLEFTHNRRILCEEFRMLYQADEAIGRRKMTAGPNGEKMVLVEPTMEYAEEIQRFRQDFLSAGGSMDGCGSLRRFENIQDWINQVESLKHDETVPSNYVPSTQFIYVREKDNIIVGVIQVRHRFNEYLEKYAGHIGYSVCPSERRKGYAGSMLQAVLPFCRNLGLEKVLVCCLEDNEGSRRTILKNSGVYESTVHEPVENVNLERYWISLV